MHSLERGKRRMAKKSRTLLIDELPGRVTKFLAYEQSRDLSPRSLKELGSVLQKLTAFLRTEKIRSLQEVTSATLKGFLLYQNPVGSPSQGKMLIWVLRKFSPGWC